jgi:hypothetical protein
MCEETKERWREELEGGRQKTTAVVVKSKNDKEGYERGEMK